MNKATFTKALSKKLSWTQKEAEQALNATLELIQSTVAKGGSVKFVGFGVFEPLAQKQKQARNPKTGDIVIIPSQKVPSFKPGQLFKRKVCRKKNNSKNKTSINKPLSTTSSSKKKPNTTNSQQSAPWPATHPNNLA